MSDSEMQNDFKAREQIDEDEFEYPLFGEEDVISGDVNESCENTNVEITSLSHVNEELNNNNDYDDSIETKDPVEVSPSTVKRQSSIGATDKVSELCLICQEKIYPMEKLTVDKKLYHKNCFRCSKCRTILAVTNFNLSNNLIYCKTHFMELFKIRGKYDDDESIGNVVLSQNEDTSETIPTTDTKGLLEKFRQLESGYVPVPSSSSKPTTVRYTQPSDDIVRSQDVQQEELPPPETAKAMVAKFKAMESQKNAPTPENSEQMKLKAKANSTPNSNVRLQSQSNDTQKEAGDYNVNEELPEEGTTKNLLNKFQNLSNNA